MALQFDNDPQLQKYYVIDLVGEGSFGKVIIVLHPSDAAEGVGAAWARASARSSKCAPSSKQRARVRAHKKRRCFLLLWQQ
jgi:hypothetical protein